MSLVKATIWIKENFAEGSRPDMRTIKRRIKNQELPGEIIGTRAYVNVSEIEHKDSLISRILNDA